MPPLRRNRDFVLLETGQLLSAFGSATTTLAYPLLVLAIGGSAAEAGLVSFAGLSAVALLALPAGVAADRWSRRGLMVAADAVRALAVGALGVAVVAGDPPLAAIVVVGAVEGAATAFFWAGRVGALRAVVPEAQLQAAAGIQEARRAVVRVGGTPLGGVLFGLGRAVPFLADAASYTCSIASLLVMRTPFQEPREPAPAARLRARVAEGFRFLWSNPFLRATTLLYSLGNFLAPGVLLLLVLAGHEHGLTPAQIGALTALFSTGTLVGSVASPFARRALPARAILLLELWTWLALWAFVAWPSVYVLAAALLPFALAAPVTDSVVLGLRLAVTPDALLGRVESARTVVALAAAPLGPVVAGLLVDATSIRGATAFFAACGLALALAGTASRGLREPPRTPRVE